MKNEEKSYITEEEAMQLLTNSNSDNNGIRIFDIYGNYSFPTDITMNTPNSACGTINTVFLTMPIKNS